ncbi:MAG: hypothetical protein HAW60_06215 [Bdellovibrionales bacterium]|nr:hypothetical protein [Bdellovibrionales bacterium]
MIKKAIQIPRVIKFLDLGFLDLENTKEVKKFVGRKKYISEVKYGEGKDSIYILVTNSESSMKSKHYATILDKGCVLYKDQCNFVHKMCRKEFYKFYKEDK